MLIRRNAGGRTGLAFQILFQSFFHIDYTFSELFSHRLPHFFEVVFSFSSPFYLSHKNKLPPEFLHLYSNISCFRNLCFGMNGQKTAVFGHFRLF